MTMRARNWTSVAITSLATAACLLLRAGTAQAATTAEYANWSQAGSSGAWTGTTTLSAAGFPVGALTSTSSALTIPTGASAFLSSDTPFGAVFGDSTGHPYANIGTATSQASSTTTITFATPTPAAGWGFAVGDIDADTVQIAATDADNAAVPVAGLGWQSAFNYCATSPKPSSCAGPGPFTDQPTWDIATRDRRGQRHRYVRRSRLVRADRRAEVDHSHLHSDHRHPDLPVVAGHPVGAAHRAGRRRDT